MDSFEIGITLILIMAIIGAIAVHFQSKTQKHLVK